MIQNQNHCRAMILSQVSVSWLVNTVFLFDLLI